MSKQKQFITACTLTFKAFDFDVTMTNGQSTLWNFITYNPNNKKNYAVFCAPSVSKSKALIKVALKKLPGDHRLVVVTESSTTEEESEAANADYCLISLSSLRSYGQEMLEIRNRDNFNNKEASEDNGNLIDMAISKDRLF
ncbi:MAG: hypothetical protein VXV96_17845 [Bdellovibrionota bacterium]|nr:hypothetical protein [Bdellovibrionota bacterium]